MTVLYTIMKMWRSSRSPRLGVHVGHAHGSHDSAGFIDTADTQQKCRAERSRVVLKIRNGGSAAAPHIIGAEVELDAGPVCGLPTVSSKNQ